MAPFVAWKRGDPATRLIDQEWLAVNGLGGYASSTVLGIPTRRYHGIFIPNLASTHGRVVLIPRWDELVEIDGIRRSLNAEEDNPALESFELRGQIPHWRFQMSGRTLEKRLVLPNRQNTVCVEYRLVEGESVDLHLRPYVTFRGHDQPLSSTVASVNVLVEKTRFDLHIAGLPMPARIQTPAVFIAEYDEQDVVYRLEKSRGLDYQERLASPGRFHRRLHPGEALAVVISTESVERLPANVGLVFEKEDERMRALLGKAPEPARAGFAAQLVLAADQFLVSPVRQESLPVTDDDAVEPRRTVIAGYHWFTDWGRDAMISLEGLTLCTGRPREARAILTTFSSYVKDGLLPNLFPEGERTALYHTIDATLWFFHATERYLHYTRDGSLLEKLYPVFERIVQAHVDGTKFGIGVDPGDGLLRGGAPGYALTWMDAKVEDTVVTPRRGKPVEIQALWHNALCLMSAWSKERGAPNPVYEEMAGQVYASFNRRYWRPDAHALFDVIDGENGNDASIRPNQLFSIALRFPVLAQERWKPVFDVVTERLLTPLGLRTLDPSDPAYKSRYEGNRRERDMAYHQGLVWAWLIGPYLDARRKVSPGLRAPLLDAFESHLAEAGVGTISEIFDATPPYLPRGCIAQAWSVAEVLRSLLQS